jgi:hypothetical protein
MESKKNIFYISSMLIPFLLFILYIPSVLPDDRYYGYTGYEARIFNGSIIFQEYRVETNIKYDVNVLYSTNGNEEATDYGVWIKSGWDWSAGGYYNSIVVDIYAKAYCHTYWIHNYRIIGQEYSWEPLPLDLIFMSDDYDYQSITGDPSDDWDYAGNIDNGWRRIGFFKSYKNWFGDQKFEASLRLKVNNDIALDYHNGGYVEKGDDYGLRFIEQIQFKFIFHFKYKWWFWWNTAKSITHIIGDGNVDSGYIGSDLNKIFFVPVESSI